MIKTQSIYKPRFRVLHFLFFNQFYYWCQMSAKGMLIILKLFGALIPNWHLFFGLFLMNHWSFLVPDWLTAAQGPFLGQILMNLREMLDMQNSLLDQSHSCKTTLPPYTSVWVSNHPVIVVIFIIICFIVIIWIICF